MFASRGSVRPSMMVTSLYNQGPRGRGLRGLTSHPKGDGALNGPLDTTKTPPVLERVLRALKNRKINSQGSQKTPEFGFEIYKKRVWFKVDFCNTSHAKTSNSDAQNSKFRHRNQSKNLLGSSPKQNEVSSVLNSKSSYKQVPESLQNQ